jgi:hypothetical protein
VKRDPGRRCKAVEPMFDQFGIPCAQRRHRQSDLPDEIGPPRNVERAPRQRLIHWCIGRTIARDAALIAKRRQDSLANGNAGIFGGVMLINMKIADRCDIQVNQRMARYLFEHMIEKANAG